jgi:hypothetical protein
LYWQIREQAIGAWFLASSGLPEGHVIWANQRLQTPARPYAKLKRSGIRDDCGPGGEQRTAYDASAAPGEEITRQVAKRKKFDVECTVFSDAVVGDEQLTMGSSTTKTAADYASAAETALWLPGQLESLLVDAALGVAESGQIQDVPEQKGNTWLSRATFRVTFRYVESAEEKLGFIQAVRGTGTLKHADGSTTTFPIEIGTPYTQGLRGPIVKGREGSPLLQVLVTEVPAQDQDVVVEIVTGGVPPDLTFRWSSDGGTTWSDVLTTDADEWGDVAIYHVLEPGLLLGWNNLGSLPYEAGDSFTFSIYAID